MKKINRIFKSEKYFENKKKAEVLMPGCSVIWQKDCNEFDLTCYYYCGRIRNIVQNFYDGSAIYSYLFVPGDKWTDMAKAIAEDLQKL